MIVGLIFAVFVLAGALYYVSNPSRFNKPLAFPVASPSPTVSPDAPAALKDAVRAGRVDAWVVNTLLTKGQVEAQLEFDTSTVDNEAKSIMNAKGLTINDRVILDFEANGYKKIFDEVMTGTGNDVTVLDYYDYLGAHLRFNNINGLIKVLGNLKVSRIMGPPPLVSPT